MREACSRFLRRKHGLRTPKPEAKAKKLFLDSGERMTKIAEIVLTSALTIFGGVLVLVGGQIVIKCFLEPVHEFRKFLGEILDSLIFYANLPTYDEANEGTKKTILEAKDGFRQQAGRLMAKKKLIPWYKSWLTGTFLSYLRNFGKKKGGANGRNKVTRKGLKIFEKFFYA